MPVWFWEEHQPRFGVEVCWSGDHAAGEAWLKPLRSFGKPAFDDIAPMPFVKLQASGDASVPDGTVAYAKNGFVGALTDDNLDLMLDVFRRTPDLYTMFMDPCGGAYARAPVAATAFPRRDMAFVLVSLHAEPAAASASRTVKLLRKVAKAARFIAGLRVGCRGF